MEIKDVDKLISNLESEIKKEKKGAEQSESLSRLQEIAKTYKGEDRIVSFKELEEELKNAPPIAKIASQIEELDKLLYGGFMTQTVTTISATPKSGKTSFAMYLTTKMEKYNPLWLALEESAKSLIRKMIKKGDNAPHGYSTKSNPTVTLEWIESKIVEAIAKHDTKVVFIDQLDFIVPQDNFNDRHDLKIAHTMRVLHQLAVKWDVAIFLICHLEKMEPEQKPTTKNLRGSSAIWGEADNCMFLWRECFKEGGELIYTNNILVSLQANREDGDTGNIKMVYENGKFIEREWISSREEALKQLANF